MVIVQFMKERKDVGEYLAMKRFKPMCRVYQFERKEFVDLENPHFIDCELVRERLSFTRRLTKRKKPDVLILDEINLL